MTGLIIAFVILYVTGILSLLYGKKMVDILLSAYAFIGVFRFVTTHMEHTEYVTILAVIAGILGILLMKFAKDAAFFLLGAFIGFLLGQAVVPYFPALSTLYVLGIEVVAALAGGIILSKSSDRLIMYATSYVGGELIAAPSLFLIFASNEIEGMMNDNIQQAVVNLSEYLYGSFQSKYSLFIIAIAIVLMFFGASYQKKHK